MSECEVKTIVRHFVEFERAAHLKTKSSADEDERNIVERVAVAFAQFIRPNDQRIIEQTAVAARFRCGGQFFGKIIQFPAKPFVNLDQFALRTLVLVRFMGE